MPQKLFVKSRIGTRIAPALLGLRADARFPSLLKAYLLMFILKLSMIKNEDLTIVIIVLPLYTIITEIKISFMHPAESIVEGVGLSRRFNTQPDDPVTK